MTNVTDRDRSLDLLSYGGIQVPAPSTPQSHEASRTLSYSLATYCAIGLPLRKPTQRMEPFIRREKGEYSLNLRPYEFVLDSGTKLEVPVPHGPIPRFIILWMMSKVARTKQKTLKLPIVKEWMVEIGLKGRSDQLNDVKDQLVRLAFTEFNLQIHVDREKDGGSEMFSRRTLLSDSVFARGDVELYAQGRIGEMKWPRALVVSDWFYEAILDFTRQRSVVPIGTEGLRSLNRKPMAIDFYLYLSMRLPLIQPGTEEVVSWEKLIRYFGNDQSPSRFLKDYGSTIRQAIDAYPGADVEIDPKRGLVMRAGDTEAMQRMMLMEAEVQSRSPRRMRYRAPAKTVREPTGQPSLFVQGG